ncbi:MAG: calcium/sodium antiporter [Lachnospiraceae bacterium]|nr:calcium/sodium antiporter [Lachnospiraceae bacterium]
MRVLQSILLLVLGFVLLVKGADFFVEGAASVAKKFNIPSLIVGLTIVAMGTSLPECSVSVIASLKNSNSLAISNVVGSNIFNLMVVCGICALFVPLKVSKITVVRDLPISIVCAVLLGWFGLSAMKIVRMEGIILLCCFGTFLLLMITSTISARKKGVHVEVEGEDIKAVALWQCVLYIIGGIVAIKYGGDIVVSSAVDIAIRVGVTETVIGLTIVALGTSLPELVTSIVAARKDEVDMAVGNVIGSNIFNILLVLGVASSIGSIEFIQHNLWDIIVLVVFSLAIGVIAWFKGKINRMDGVVMLACYSAYTAFILVR